MSHDFGGEKKRPWRPGNFCPFCPGNEETGYGWEVLLPNRFPMLSFDAPRPKQGGFYRRARAIGQCSVIVETPEHDLRDLNELSPDAVTGVVALWKNVTAELKENPRVAYVSHGQLYATPFIPLKVRLEIDNSGEYFKRTGECLFCRILREELKGERAIYENESFAIFMPFFANWPFEIHIYPKRHVQWLTQLTEEELTDLADALRVATGTLNTVLEREMPYTMMVYQAPFRGTYGFYHLHIEFYPILRKNGRIKYAAGIEMGTWDFTYDGIPEENAEKLKGACRKVIKRIGARGRCFT